MQQHYRPFRLARTGCGETLSDASITGLLSGLSAQRAPVPDAETERELNQISVLSADSAALRA
jgi:hypothetical protein